MTYEQYSPEWLVEHCDHGSAFERAVQRALTRLLAENKQLRAALEQPVEQEPVAWAVMQNGEICWDADYPFSNEPAGWCDSDHECVPLYTHPQPRQPLTDDAVIGVAKSIGIEFRDEDLDEQIDDILAFARAIERFHGIGGEK